MLPVPPVPPLRPRATMHKAAAQACQCCIVPHASSFKLASHMYCNAPVCQICAGLEEHQLKELAYVIFFGACGKRSNADLIQVMRAQLEVSPWSSCSTLQRRMLNL